MTALILHPNDELFYADLQKEIIASLFSKDRILYQKLPLWIEFEAFDLKEKSQIKEVQIGELYICEDSVYCPVSILCSEGKINSKLTLVCLHKGKKLTSAEIAGLKEKPVRQIKVFRLGSVADQGPHAKSISKSVWCKLHNTRATIE